MEQQNNPAALNDTAGVLPMDTGVTINGIYDEGDNNPSSSANASAKKGRGRPPKSTGPPKASISSDTPKRGRGRPPKTGEAIPSTNKVAVSKETIQEISTNGDASKKKRGRPSKTSVPNVQVNGISKPQVQSAPVSTYQEQEHVEEPAKKKRGRPSSGSLPKKAVVIATPSAPKAASSTKKRGRPSGSGIKKSASKPKVSASNAGSAKKRGRPKKAAASPTPVATTPVNEITATVTTNNV
jgi:hypothetical protein